MARWARKKSPPSPLDEWGCCAHVTAQAPHADMSLSPPRLFLPHLSRSRQFTPRDPSRHYQEPQLAGGFSFYLRGRYTACSLVDLCAGEQVNLSIAMADDSSSPASYIRLVRSHSIMTI